MLKTVLRKLLMTHYQEWKVDSIKDVCTLTRMCILSLIFGVLKILIILGLLFIAVLAVVPPMVSLSSLFLELRGGWLHTAVFGIIMITIYSFAIFLLGIVLACLKEIPVLPTYISKRLGHATKDKTPNKNVILLKDMWRSFKDKTCVKFDWED